MMLCYNITNLSSSSPNLYIERELTEQPKIMLYKACVSGKRKSQRTSNAAKQFYVFILAQYNGTVSLRSVSSFNELI